MSKAKKIISLFIIFALLLVGGISVSADTLENENYIVYTENLGSLFGDGDGAVTYTDNTNAVLPLYVRNGNSGFLSNPFFQITGTKAVKNFECQPTWKLDTTIFNGSKQYIFDFYIGVVANRTNAYVTLDKFRFFFGDFNNKYYTPIEYIALNSSQGLAHFKFVVDGQILNNSHDICRFEFLDVNSSYLYFGLIKDIEGRTEYSKFIIKEYTEAEQVLDEEEDRANKGGNDSVDELGSVIPNDSGGFIDSLSNFVGAMAYDGTECNWKFPALYLPAIQGVMSNINLTDELEIPFEYWISKIPSGILTLVRSLLTIALIVFCFKELYNIISYVLTLRGGGNSE